MAAKRIAVAVALALATSAQAECYLQTETQSTAQGTIDQVTDVKPVVVKKLNGEKTCTVTFVAHINGKLYQGRGYREYEETTTTDGNACGAALEDGKAEIIRQFSKAEINANSTLLCSDDPAKNPNPAAKHLEVGQVVNDEDVPYHPTRGRFNYRGSECRYYINTEVNGKDLYQWQGVMCQVNNGQNWVILDKY